MEADPSNILTLQSHFLLRLFQSVLILELGLMSAVGLQVTHRFLPIVLLCPVIQILFGYMDWSAMDSNTWTWTLLFVTIMLGNQSLRTEITQCDKELIQSVSVIGCTCSPFQAPLLWALCSATEIYTLALVNF